MSVFIEKIMRLTSKHGVFKAVVLITIISIIISLIITFIVSYVAKLSEPEVGYMIAVICPLVITPPISYIILGLADELNQNNAQLQITLDEVKELKGFIPICASCKNIRDDEGYWQKIEKYISHHTDAEFSHSICPSCKEELYGDFLRENKKP